jgi:hypothetical protein
MRHNRTELRPYQVTFKTECDADGCGNSAEGYDPNGWYHFDSQHGDLGNDSSESFQSWDACSWACYLNIVNQIWSDYGSENRNPTLEIDDKDYYFVADMLSKETGRV